MFQTDGKDLSPNVFVFTRGVTKVRVSDADRNCNNDQHFNKEQVIFEFDVSKEDDGEQDIVTVYPAEQDIVTV